jgi:hypothetical protein
MMTYVHSLDVILYCFFLTVEVSNLDISVKCYLKLSFIKVEASE